MKYNNILFIDIETVPQEKSYNQLPERIQKLWDKKAAFIRTEDNPLPQDLYERAGIYAEFGKIISIALGYFAQQENKQTLRIKDISNHDEKDLLISFKELIEKKFKSRAIHLCAHNGKEFDFPYIARRMVINSISLPKCLQLSGKKPWEVPHIDTMEMWKFGDYKNFTSLDLLAATMGISSSKSDIDGSQVYHVYYEEKDLDRIATYCKKDVAVLAQVYLRLQNQPALSKESIIYTK